ncbi:MAG: hypothetical protein J6C52_01455, partial [Clostridia bacterium]|nr:hypothetical protein [Clostridia bacterium]
TEMTTPAYSADAEDEAVQAELLTNLWRLFFAQRSMEAIIYWNVPDGYAHRAEPGDMTAGQNIYYGGLLGFDLHEKPAWKALDRLVNYEWHTETTAPVKNGTAEFRGFYGNYNVIVHAGGRQIPAKLRHTKGIMQHEIII